jgi:flagellar basal body-associated protein FliL
MNSEVKQKNDGKLKNDEKSKNEIEKRKVSPREATLEYATRLLLGTVIILVFLVGINIALEWFAKASTDLEATQSSDQQALLDTYTQLYVEMNVTRPTYFPNMMISANRLAESMDILISFLSQADASTLQLENGTYPLPQSIPRSGEVSYQYTNQFLGADLYNLETYSINVDVLSEMDVLVRQKAGEISLDMLVFQGSLGDIEYLFEGQELSDYQEYQALVGELAAYATEIATLESITDENSEAFQRLQEISTDISERIGPRLNAIQEGLNLTVSGLQMRAAQRAADTLTPLSGDIDSIIFNLIKNMAGIKDIATQLARISGFIFGLLTFLKGVAAARRRLEEASNSTATKRASVKQEVRRVLGGAVSRQRLKERQSDRQEKAYSIVYSEQEEFQVPTALLDERPNLEAEDGQEVPDKDPRYQKLSDLVPKTSDTSNGS